LLLLTTVVFCDRPVFKGTAQEQFQQFKDQFNRNYKSSVEERIRFEIFSKNLLIAKDLTDRSKGMTDYGVNEFADLDPREFREMYLMPKGVVGKKPYPNHHWNITVTPVKKLPEGQFFDWRYPNPTTGYDGACISPVYNQGQCGSCWTFSATEQIEAISCITGHTGGHYIQNSMQQIVSCDPGGSGCSGGDPWQAFEYIQSAGGQDSYAAYPYTAENTGCAFNRNAIQSRVSGWGWAGQGNEGAMLSYLSSAPISICCDAQTWQYYNGGVVMGSTCGTAIDHAIQITGYGTVSGVQVWVVRNSWGAGWGYGGYLYVQYGVNACGIAEYPCTVAAA